jgi:hypothetical protein
MENHLEDDISIKKLFYVVKEWLQYLKTKLKLFIIVCIVGGILGFVYSYYIKTKYTATLTFALEEKSNGNGSGLSSIATSFGLNLGGGDGGAFAGDNIIELMKSRLLIEKTLLTSIEINSSKELLVNRFIEFNKTKRELTNENKFLVFKFDSVIRNNFTRAQDSILGVIQSEISEKNLDVTKLDKKLSIITVKVKSGDELFAKLFCENLVKNVANFYIETKTGKSRKNIQLLESRVDSVKRELDQALYGRATFSDQNLSLIRQSAAVPKLKQELRVQMLSTMYGELVKNLEFSKLSLMREEPLIQIIDSPILPLDKTNINRFLSVINGMFLAMSLLVMIFTLKLIFRKVMSFEK